MVSFELVKIEDSAAWHYCEEAVEALYGHPHGGPRVSVSRYKDANGKIAGYRAFVHRARKRGKRKMIDDDMLSREWELVVRPETGKTREEALSRLAGVLEDLLEEKLQEMLKEEKMEEESQKMEDELQKEEGMSRQGMDARSQVGKGIVIPPGSH